MRKFLNSLYELIHHPLVITTFVFIVGFGFYKKESLAWSITQFLTYFPLASLLACSAFINSKWIWLVVPSVLSVGIGSMFKIMHWPNADLLIYSGLSVLTIGYLIYFFKKDPKVWIDYIKLTFWLSLAYSMLAQFEYLPMSNYALSLAFGLMYISFLELVIRIWKNPDSDTSDQQDVNGE